MFQVLDLTEYDEGTEVGATLKDQNAILTTTYQIKGTIYRSHYSAKMIKKENETS